MQQHENYTRDIIAGQEEALSKILSKVPEGALVLDIGCGSGMLGKYLSMNKRCVVDGVDIDPQAVELAKPKYRKVGVFNLEQQKLTDAFPVGAYDCIVMADVVEHIVHPEMLFENVKQLLKPDGIMLFSIPNIAHISAGLELVLGKFGYRNSGLLDATHVRFYSRQGFIDKLETNGIYPFEIDTVCKAIDSTEFKSFRHFPQSILEEIIDARSDALTYQWIVSARLYASTIIKQIDQPQHAVIEHTISVASRLYFRTANEENYCESKSIPGLLHTNSHGQSVMHFYFTEDNCQYPLRLLRLDPISDTAPCLIDGIALLTPYKETVWAASKIEDQDIRNAHFASAYPSTGGVLVPLNYDPQWHLPLPEDVLQSIRPGFSLQLGINTAIPAINDALALACQNSLSALSEASAKIIDLQTQCSKQQQEKNATQINATLFQANARLFQSQIEQLQSSLSWRITKPLRWLRSKL